jgi:hypothetical protein
MLSVCVCVYLCSEVQAENDVEERIIRRMVQEVGKTDSGDLGLSLKQKAKGRRQKAIIN